jgi:hypothetical protein
VKKGPPQAKPSVKGALTLVPIAQPNRHFCFAEPEDAIAMAARIGCEVSVSEEGIPWVGPDVLRYRDDYFHHDLYLAFLSDTAIAPAQPLWREYRRLLHAKHLKDAPPMPPGCDVILYFTEGDMAFVLTSQRRKLEAFVTNVLYARFPSLLKAEEGLGSADALLASWVLQEADARGVRLKSMGVREAAPHQSQLEVTGVWGRDENSLVEGIGIPGTERFHRVMPWPT